MSTRDEITQALEDLFAAERNARRVHDDLAERPQDTMVSVLADATKAALKETDEDEATLRLVRIAGLLGEFGGPEVVDLLVDVLGSEHPEARNAAGEQLEELAFDRFKEVALGVERALDRLPVGNPALPELPYILTELPEPGVPKLLSKFLGHEDPDAVAAAIETLTDVGDPAAIKFLEGLTEDSRTVELGDPESNSAEAEQVSLGDLALEAIELLRAVQDSADDDEDSARAPGRTH